jgi:quercetin dioxygenase-like cupin family protein
MEEAMQLNRRSVLVLGAVAAAPVAAASKAAASERYAPDQGTELLPGVRQVDLSEWYANIPGYATVSMRDIILEPGAEIPVHPMENDMVCHMLEGELEISLDGEEFTVSENGVYTCAIGTEEGATNATDRVAIMRVTDLHKA